jgi:hypothetical protein
MNQKKGMSTCFSEKRGRMYLKERNEEAAEKAKNQPFSVPSGMSTCFA